MTPRVNSCFNQKRLRKEASPKGHRLQILLLWHSQKDKINRDGKQAMVARGYGWRAGALRGEGAVCILIMTVAACISAEIHRTGHNKKSPLYCMIHHKIKMFKRPMSRFFSRRWLFLIFLKIGSHLK